MTTLTEALGWTLLHSLWQATIIAAVFYLVRALIRHRPVPMYNGALGALLLVLGWSGYTFIDLYTPPPVPDHATVTYPALASPPAAVAPAFAEPVAVARPSSWSWWATGVAWIDRYISFVAMAWLFGTLLLSARLAGGMWYLERLRRDCVYPVPAWEATAATLAVHLGIRRPVTLLASGRAKVPMVIGHLKPILLLPLALLSSLPPEQLEAIIAHELAHVRRHDYLVNILQSFVELVFFYHPAVRWLSAVVRQEREKCCDDLAVSLSGDTITYAKALAEAEAFQHTSGTMMMAFARQRGNLLARIERLVGPRTSPASLVAKGYLMVPMLLMVIYLAGSDTLARVVSHQPALAFGAVERRLPDRTEVHRSPSADDTLSGDEPQSATRAVPNPPPALDTIPSDDENEDRRSSFSFHFNDSTNFIFDMNLDFDEEDSTAYPGFRHWRFSSNDTFPDFAGSDSLWRESIEELSETMEGFSEELATYLEDSLDTKALQRRMNSVQRELSRLQAELGISLQRTFSDEKMEALQKQTQKAQERLQRNLQEEQSWRNEESNRKLEELKRLTEEMEQQPWFDDSKSQSENQLQGNFDDTVTRLEKTLLADGLIKSGKEYRFELKPKGLFINKKKQDEELLDKYRELLNISESTSFSMTRTAQ
jgi:beta-lactamase regulating signal transducer with metallopeptidase domain